MSDKMYNPSEIAILVVDEFPQIRSQIKRILDKLTIATIAEASRPEDAVNLLKENHYDLVICDIYMGHGKGKKVVQHIRERNTASDIPILVLSGEASEHAVVNASDLGANEYMLKPFHADELSDKIEKLLNQYGAPNEFEDEIRSGEKAFMQKKYHEAIKFFDLALLGNNESAKAHYLKALSMIAIGEVMAAKEILLGNTERNRDYYRNWRTLADIALKEERVRDAADYLKSELELHPKQPSRQTKLGVLLLKKASPEEAIEHFRQALLENQKYRDALLGMAHAYIKMDNLDKAIYYFKRTRKHHSDDEASLRLAVKYCIQYESPRKAELFLRDEHAQKPKDKLVLQMLVRFFYEQKRKPEALNYISKLLEIQGNNPEGLQRKAKILMEEKKYHEAIPYLEILVEEGKSLLDYDMLGLAYIRTSAIAKATVVLERAMLGHAIKLPIVEKLAYCYYINKDFMKSTHLLMHMGSKGKRQLIDLELQNQIYQSAMFRRRSRNQKVS